MLIFWLSLLFGGWWFEESIYKYLINSFCDYMDSFDCYYLQDWNNSQSKLFVRVFLGPDSYEVYFLPIKSDEEAIIAFTEFGIDMTKYDLQNAEDRVRLKMDLLRRLINK